MLEYHELGVRPGRPAIVPPVTAAPSAVADRRAESSLLERISQGDERAMEALYHRYHGPLFAMALRRTRTEQLAHEVVQDAFTAAWQAASRFDAERGALSSWLFRLVRNKAVDALRREGDELNTLAEDALDPSLAPDQTDEDAWVRIRDARVRAAVAALPDPQRVAIELAFFAGLAHSEVADQLGIPLGTAKKRIRSGLLRLRVQLATAVAADPDGCPIVA